MSTTPSLKLSYEAQDAYYRGEKPLTKWDKKDIMEKLKGIDQEKYKLLDSINEYKLRKIVLKRTGSFVTSSYTKKTSFYAVNLKKINSWSIDEIKEKIKKIEEKIYEHYRGDISYIEWNGISSHPKPKHCKLTNVNIEEHGAYYLVTDDNEELLLKLKIALPGTKITRYGDNKQWKI